MHADLPVDAIADGSLSWGNSEVQAHIRYLDNCEWYVCEDGFLYIVDLGYDELVHGPDNEVAEEMSVALIADAPFHRLEEHVESIAYVHHILHRFNIEDGFYHA